MSLRLACLLSVCFLLFTSAGRPHSDETAFRQIDAIVQSLSDISGLSENHPVPYGRMNKHQLRRFLSKRIRHTLRPEEIQADELALKMFGLVPQGFNLKQSTIDLLTEQAAAFYDYDEKKLFLLDDSSFASEVTTLAHELAHALADQHFDLNKYMDEASADDDSDLAHTAVVEGQASWLMIAYDLKQAGHPPTPTEEELKGLLNSSEGSLGDYPVLKSSPLYIQQSLLFPYTDGTLFFNEVYRREGKAAFRSVFTDAPSDSAQILHPDRYFARLEAAKPELAHLPFSDLSGKNTLQQLSAGAVGEFDHKILLWQFVGEPTAKSLAPHLSGGQFRIIRAADKRPVLLYSSEWDSNDRARQFFGLYKRVLKGKWSRCDALRDAGDVFEGEGDNGYFAVTLSERTLRSVEGLADGKDADQIVKRFREVQKLRPAESSTDSSSRLN